MRIRRIGVGVLVAIAVVTPRASDRVAITVVPAVSFAPANLQVSALIETNRDNRALEVVADSSDFYRSSWVELAGDQAPRRTTFEFRSLPSGWYVVTIRVLGSQGQIRAVARDRVHVLAPLGR